MKNYISAILLAIFAIPSFGQSISIFDIDTTNFPTMKAKFYAFDKDGKQQRPSASELTITENGINRTITNVSCVPPTPPKTVSIAMSIDISGSMGNYFFGEFPIDLGKLTAKELCNSVTMPPSSFALQTCNDKAFILQDFTTDKNKIISKISQVSSIGENNFVEQLLNQRNGLLNIAKFGKNKRVAVIYTDAWWYALTAEEFKSCLDTCNKYNIEFYAVIYSKKEGDPFGIKSSLRELCSKTGGFFYDDITSIEAARDIANKIQQISQEGIPCEITWNSDIYCENNNINLALKWQGLSSPNIYLPPYNTIANVKVNPNFIAFGKRRPISQNDTIITLTAQNADFTVTGINRKFGSSDFNILNTNFPLTIPKNKNKVITLRFNPFDSSTKYVSFEIETDKCSAYFSANGGYQVAKSNSPNSSLKLIHPNGGEIFVAGSDTLITWTGVSPTDTVTLEFSHDYGKTWKLITNQATGLKCKWINIPLPVSTQCLVKVTQTQKSKNNSDTNELLTLRGHAGYVNGVNFSPNGNQIATASNDGTAKIWDTNTGDLIRTFTGHSNYVYAVKFSPDGSQIATASNDGKAKIWDTNTGDLIRTLTHDFTVKEITFSPDGNHIATTSPIDTAFIYIWDINDGRLIKKLVGHTQDINSISYSPDGSRIASASLDSTIKIWEINSGSLLRTLTGHNHYVIGVAYSPNGRLIATSSYDNTCKIWDANTGSLIRTLTGHNSYLSGVTFSPDGSQVATSGFYERIAKIWDINTGKIIRTLPVHKDYINGIAYSPDGSRVATACNDKTAKIWMVVDVTESIQQDISDSVFSTLAPSPASKDIDMKQCIIGVSKDSLISTFMINNGTYQYRVDSIAITGANASQFRLVSGTPPFVVPANANKAVEFNFKPTSVGIKIAQLNIYTPSDTLFQTIQGEGIAPQLEIVNNLIDFGSVLVGEYKDSTQVVTIKNVGTVALNINNSLHLGPNDIDFTTLSGAPPFSLNAGETAKMNLRFAPKESGRTSGRLQFEFNGAGSPATVQLFGTGIEKYSQIENDKSNLFIDSLICGKATSRDTVQISNSGTDTLKIVSLTLEGNNSKEFKVDNLPSNNILSNQKMNIVVNYIPTQTGLHKARLKIESNSKVDSVFYIDLEGRKDSIDIKTDKQVIDFGKVLVNKSKDTTLYIQNNGTLNNTIFTSLNNNIFASDKNKLNISTIGNDSIKVSFKGSAIENTYNGNLTLTDSICKTTKVIQLNTEVYSVPQVQISIGSDSAYTEEQVEIPVSILANNKLLSSGVTAISFELEMNKTILFPIGVNSTIDGDNRIIKFDNVPIKNVGVNEVAKLKFIATLGNAEETKIKVRNIIPIGNDAEFDTTNGNFKLLGVCKEGGERFLSSSFNQTKLLSIAPNPATESIEIEYSNADEGEAEIIISNLLGQTILTQKLEKTQTGKTKLDLSQLPTGQYSILFKTETVLENRVIQVIK